MAQREGVVAQEISGGCQCGKVRYRIAGALPPVYACHCRECQKQSASAFGLSLPVRIADLAVEGVLHDWERDTDSGHRSRAFFCPACGSRIYHQSSRSVAAVTIKAGTLDDTASLVPVAHIWVSRRQPWVVIDPDVPAHPTQPDDMAAWRASFAGESA